MSEVLNSILFFIIFIGILIIVMKKYEKKSLKKLQDNYDASKNKSRREPEEPEQRGRKVDEGTGRDTGFKKPDSSVPTPTDIEGQSSVPLPTPSSVGKDKPKPRKVSGIFRRFRRKSK